MRLAIALLLSLAGCGDDSTNSVTPDAPGTVDAPRPDAAPDAAPDAPAMPDGGMPDANFMLRSGTLVVSDVAITDPAVAGLALGGAAISLDFADLGINDGGSVIFGTGAIGTCTVLQFDVGSAGTHKPHPLADEGAVTLTGAGLKRPVPNPCTFRNGQYVCVADSAAGTSGTYSASNTSGGALVTVTGHDFSSNQIGMWMSLSGFADSGMNHTFALVNVAGTSAQLAVPAGQAANASNSPFSGVGYVLVQGAGPIPGGRSSVDFVNLGSGTDQVTISLAANADYPSGISATVPPVGKGMLLDGAGTGCTDCAQPHQFPTTGTQTVSFACDPTLGSQTGTCGESGSFSNVLLVIAGKTTDGSLTGAPPYAMPDPVTSYATFQCTFPLATHGQIPLGAITAILGTNPTRIETAVFRFGFAQGTDSQTQNSWSVLAGHGLIGHTDR